MSEDPSRDAERRYAEHKSLSCRQCRKRKTKCDRANPCGQCILRGQENECTPVQQAIYIPTDNSNHSTFSYGNHTHGPSTVFSGDTIGVRLNKIEATLGIAVEKINRVADTISNISFITDHSSEYEPPPQKRQKKRTTSEGMGEQFQSLIENAVMRHSDKGDSQNNEFIQDYYEQAPTEDSMQERSSILDQRTGDPPIDIAFAFLQLTPDSKACKILIEFYFEYVDWTTRVLHLPRSHECFVEISETPVLKAVYAFRPATICCYLACLTLSLQFATNDLLERVGLNKSKASTLAESLFCGCQQLLWASNFLTTRDLDHLSCVVLMGIYQNCYQKQADAHWALLGTAIKVAQNLGCNSIDADGYVEPVRHYLQTPADREIARRIWWNFLWLDWSHATSHRGLYSANPDQNHTLLPTNVIIENNNVIETNSDEYTSILYTIFRMRYVDIHRQVVDLRNRNNGPLEKKQITGLMNKLTSIHESIPNCLKFNGNLEIISSENHTQNLESAMLEIIYQNRILRLHRTYQFAGCYDKYWHFARVQSVEAAKKIIKITEKYSKIHPFMLGYWLVVFYLLGAATTVVFELCCCPDDNQDVQSCRECVKISLDILKSVEESSEAALNSLRVLEELCRAEDEIRSEFLKKDSVKYVTEALHKGKDHRLRQIFHDMLKKSLRIRTIPIKKRGYENQNRSNVKRHSNLVNPQNVQGEPIDTNEDQEFDGGQSSLEYVLTPHGLSENFIGSNLDQDDPVIQMMLWTFDHHDWA